MKLRGFHIALFIFIVVPVILVFCKFFLWGYSFENIVPRTGYNVSLNINAKSYDDYLQVSTFLPVSNYRQNIINESQDSPAFKTTLNTDETGRKISWDASGSEDGHYIKYNFEARLEAVEFQLEEELLISQYQHPGITKFLKPTRSIQSNHPDILYRSNELVGNNDSLIQNLKVFFDEVYSMGSRPFKGLTDALTTLKLREASCNGKSRLFVAFCRSKDIPARLVGGLVLENGTKKTSHQWTEVYINGHWVPFDPLNGHFAYLPSNYLELYKGDEFLFSHSPNIEFEYSFFIKRRLVNNPKLANQLKDQPLNSYLMWQAFEKAGIPLSLLKIILMIPLGAMAVAIARNVIGFKTFGVFLPALIAVAISQTGILWGLLAFVLVIALVSLIHFPLEKLGILYTPKLVIMLVSVVITFIGLSILGMKMNYNELAYITLFPVVVITITAERFARTIMEEDLKQALNVTVQTLIVVLMAYLAMNSTTMESFFLAFPELFLLIIGLMLLLGRWIGLRISEYFRFSKLA